MNVNTVEKQKIVYVGPFSFPNGGAAARRILGNAKSLRAAGYNVIIGSGQLSDNKTEYTMDRFDDFEVHSLGERTAENLPSFLKNLKYLSIGKKTITWLDNMVVKPSVIILYSGYSPYFMRLLPWCKKNNVKLVFDAVEWYEATSTFKAILSPYYWNIELAMRYYSVKTGNIIAISSYLKKYYESKKASVIVVPPTIDTNAFLVNIPEKISTKLVIAYTGTPGHKDLFNNYLEAIIRTDFSGERIIFKVAGLTVEDILKYPALRERNIEKEFPGCIATVGVVSHSHAIDVVGQADFSVLLRKPTRVAQAGFPTKVVESLTVGTPVIANLTSDLQHYLKDGENSFVCNDYTPDSLIEVLEKILKLSNNEINEMRTKARNTAESYFDYRIYVNSFKIFLSSLQ
jgi:glycosyltransferase involved in cell wall biosynthesis